MHVSRCSGEELSGHAEENEYFRIFFLTRKKAMIVYREFGSGFGDWVFRFVHRNAFGLGAPKQVFCIERYSQLR
jgi:hypothetical protein